MAGSPVTQWSTCSWCSARVPVNSQHCPECGAALVQMLADPDLPIPGVTTVEPGLQAYDAQPWRLHGPSPAQGFAGTAIAGAVAGGPAGLVALGGLAAVAAAEYLSAGQETSGASIKPELVGELRGYVAQALERQAEAAAHPTDQTRS